MILLASHTPVYAQPSAFERGLIIETSGPDDEVVKVLAPLTTPHETLEAGLAIVAEAVDEIVSTQKLAAE